MANKGNILQINAGQLVGKEAFEKASQGHNVFGCGFVQDGILLHQHENKAVDWESFNEFQKAYQSASIICYFGTHEKNSSEEDIQPYVLKDEEAEHMAFFAVGDYSNIKQPASTRPAEHRVYETQFLPAFGQYLQNSKEPSLDGFMGSLDLPDVQKALLNMGVFGVIKVLATTGEIKTFPQSQHYAKFPWGEMADVNGYEEGQKKESKEVSKLKSFFGSKPKSEAEKPATAPTAKPETVIHKPVKEEKPKTATAAISDVPPGMVMARPSSTLKTDKQVQKWYQQKFQPDLVKGWRERPWVAIDVRSAEGPDTEVQSITAIEEAYKAAEKAKIKSTEVSSRAVPPKMREDFEKKFLASKKLQDKMTGMVVPPTTQQLEEDEKKYPTFFDHTKLHLEQTFKWGDEEIEILARDYLPILKAWLRAHRSAYFKHLNEHPKKVEKAEETPVAPQKTTSFFGKKAA